MDVDPAALGAIIRRVLIASETLPAIQGNDDFDAKLAQRFGLKSFRALYAGVRMVSLREAAGWFICTPMRHRRGFNWEAFSKLWPEKQPLKIPSGSPDAEWGAVALEALRRSV